MLIRLLPTATTCSAGAIDWDRAVRCHTETFNSKAVFFDMYNLSRQCKCCFVGELPLEATRDGMDDFGARFPVTAWVARLTSLREVLGPYAENAQLMPIDEHHHVIIGIAWKSFVTTLWTALSAIHFSTSKSRAAERAPRCFLALNHL